MMQVQVLGFDILKELYCQDMFFENIFQECHQGPHKQFHLQQDFLFKGNC